MGRAWGAPPRGRRAGAFVLVIGLCLLGTAALAAAAPMHPAAPQVAPDLRLANAAISPLPPYEGDIVRVSVTVANVGDLAAESASIELVDSRPNAGDFLIGSSDLSVPLAVGASTPVAMPQFVAAGVGEHTLTIRVASVTPAEANVSNDVLSMWMRVLPARTTPPPPSDGLHIEALEALGFGALAGFVLVVIGIGVVVSLVARSREDELEPPPPEPPDRSPPPLWPP